jgi:DNA-binding IclR family transcriptional regulator
VRAATTPTSRVTTDQRRTLEKLMKEINEIRRNGYALDNEENELGVRCIAVCVHDLQGLPNNAFSISAPAVLMMDDRVKQLSVDILRTKDAIQKILGR